MFNKILIRYGELTLKNRNRDIFIKQLEFHVKRILATNVKTEYDRMFVEYNQKNLINLQYVFGIHSYSPVIELEKDINLIKTKTLELSKNYKTFKINSRRSDKSFVYNSNQLNNILGSYVLDNNLNIKVDVNDPEIIINVEIRQKKAYIFIQEIKGLGGLPVGVSGKVLHLMSGGIDSPVAAYLLMKRGLKVDFLSFISPPQTDAKTIDKMQRLIKILKLYQGETKFYLADYSKLMNYIHFVSNQAYKINLMRRSFYRIASKIALNNNIIALSNGENLGQVASQTLESLSTIASASKLLILRPLLINDKNETIEIAKKIGTYEISIEKANETCELFAPKKPVTKPKLEYSEQLESELNLLDELENELLENNMQIINI
ncbi:tRNA uracil 4-sulfurtransferase ThiI [Mycoplasma sp. 1018B]|uniref:tRNA uracil 4-sulfurtransferase ThiI n=1 Tax=Mycoplasma sp. 1018B TaxID=2967302 RepID=UPI00211BDC9B|nr:tRNA uracil 4-sulfurtransferase ThiI [Mycoplasma sp. 1018B]UUM19153.1 tRNA 4-thiouridine(8) synthase ThiI [Mycoplasma sp. 1018B]